MTEVPARCRTICAALLVAALAACSSSREPENPEATPVPTPELQPIADGILAADPTVRGAVVHVLTADGAWTVTAGATAPDAGYRIASNTKTFTAAATLRLVEDAELGLDDPIAEHIAPESVEALEGDGYDVAAITVRHLLLHSSGLYDYATDPAYEAAAIAGSRPPVDPHRAGALRHGAR